MAEFQILDRVLAAGSQLLKLGSVDAVSAQVPSLSATLAVLETIVRTVGNVQVYKEAFIGLSADANNLIALLAYWAAQGSERITEVYASIESLYRTLESIAEFAPRLTADSSLAIFVVSGEDTERIQGYRQIMQSASKNFEINFLQSVHFQLANMAGCIMKFRTVEYVEADRELVNNNQTEDHVSKPLIDWSNSKQVKEPLEYTPLPPPLD